MANLMLSVMGAFVEFERALIRERQREGIALAKQRGAYRAARRHSRRSGWMSCGVALRLARRRRSLPASLASAGKLCINT